MYNNHNYHCLGLKNLTLDEEFPPEECNGSDAFVGIRSRQVLQSSTVVQQLAILKIDLIAAVVPETNVGKAIAVKHAAGVYPQIVPSTRDHAPRGLNPGLRKGLWVRCKYLCSRKWDGREFDVLRGYSAVKQGLRACSHDGAVLLEGQEPLYLTIQ